MSEGENCLKSDVIRKVERIVCDCVNKAFCKDKYSLISPLSLYEGKTNIPFVKGWQDLPYLWLRMTDLGCRTAR